jgi:hypothetical protein
METDLMSTVKNSILDLLTEAYEGPPDPSTTWFIDNEPDTGILPVFDTVSAAEASFSVDGSGREGTTIAANAEHLRWSLANANGALRGEPYLSSWNESWLLVNADAEKWDHLRRSLRDEFETLREAVKKQEELQGAYLTGSLALIAHAAYHLGTIRQMIERVRAAQTGSGK